MIYPEIDAAVIDAAREKYTRAAAAVEATKTEITAAEAALKSAEANRKNLISAAACGGEVLSGQHRAAEKLIRDREAELLWLRDIHAAQNSIKANAERALNGARGLAHRPRLLHAIYEMRAARTEIDAARRSLKDAEERDAEARRVILESFNNGWPMPTHFPRGWMTQPDMLKALGDGSESSLRQLWGVVADEAFEFIEGKAL
jgi:hypothetical protein